MNRIITHFFGGLDAKAREQGSHGRRHLWCCDWPALWLNIVPSSPGMPLQVDAEGRGENLGAWCGGTDQFIPASERSITLLQG